MNNDDMIFLFLERRDITDKRVIDAFKNVDRKDFIPEEYEGDPYVDSPIPIKEGQTTSQPYIIAKMLQELEIERNHKVLEIGFGCGYVTALLSLLAKKVIATDIYRSLLNDAMKNLRNYKNIELHITKKELGWRRSGPYDRIIVNAAARTIPNELVEQLKDNGIMVLPIGEHFVQNLVKVKKTKEGIKKEKIFECMFVPLKY